jgi:ferredoxin
VDEFTCIGCRNCCNVCPKTFDIEDDWGRARVMKQGVDVQDKLQVMAGWAGWESTCGGCALGGVL